MSISENVLASSLKKLIPNDLVSELINEFKHIKQQHFLQKWRPAELNCARFSECVLRILQHISGKPVTPFGQTLNSNKIIQDAENDVSLDDSVRFLIPRLIRVVLDFRNKRDVAHLGGEVSPNEQDSMLVVSSASWIMAELVRKYHSVSIEEASKILKSIIELKIPVVNEFDGFVRVLDTTMNSRQKTLCILYYRQPEKIKDSEIAKWIEYANISNYRAKILKPLHKEAIIHYQNNYCELTSKGIAFVDKYLSISNFTI